MSVAATLLLFVLLAMPITEGFQSQPDTASQPRPNVADAPPQIRVSSADANGLIAIDTGSQTLKHVLLLEERLGSAVDADVAVYPLVSPGPGQFDIALQNCDGQAAQNPISFQPKSVVRVCVVGTLLSVGSYKGSLTLSYRQQLQGGSEPRRDNYTLAIERRQPAAILSMNGLPVGPRDTAPPLIGNIPFIGNLIFPDEKLPMRVSLSETAGVGADVTEPTLTELSLFGSSDNAVQVPFTPVKVTPDDISKVQPAQQQAGQQQSAQPQYVHLDPYATEGFTLEVSDRLAPGQYHAKVLARTLQGALATSQIEIRLRHQWWLALVVIGLGAWASLLLRRWIGSGRTQAVQDRRLERQLEQVHSRVNVTNDAISQYLVSRLEWARSDIRLDVFQGQLDALCSTVERLLPPLEIVNRRLARTTLGRQETYVQQKLQDALPAVQTAFLDSGKTDDAVAVLQTIPGEIDKAERAASVQATFDYTREVLVAPVFDSRRTALNGRLADAQSKLDNMDFDGADGQWKAALVQMRTTMREQLKPYVDAWEQVLAAPLADPNNDPLSRARTELPRATQALEQLDQPDDNDVRTIMNRYNDAVRRLKAVSDALPKEQRSKIREDYSLADVPRVWQEPARNTNFANAVRATSASVTMRLIDLVLRTPLSPLALPFVWPRLSTDAKVTWTDRTFSIMTMLLSAIIGVQLLWVPNATWGGLNDYITALVWGFGLHQLNETARQSGPAAISAALRGGGGDGH
jgi:hypothetical protein